MDLANKDIYQQERWESYRSGMSNAVRIRSKELEEMLILGNIQDDLNILEVGSGSGALTFYISDSLKKGKFVTADVNIENLQHIEREKKDKIETFLFPHEYLSQNKFEKLENNFFDRIITLATFHHFDTKRDGNGNNTGKYGREKFISDMSSKLKKGGELVIGDVINNTLSQRYFDSIDCPLHCAPSGHPHSFFELTDFLNYENLGLEVVELYRKYVPWHFETQEEAAVFLNRLHNAKCSTDESLKHAEKILNLKYLPNDGKFRLDWELGFVKYKKS